MTQERPSQVLALVVVVALNSSLALPAYSLVPDNNNADAQHSFVTQGGADAGPPEISSTPSTSGIHELWANAGEILPAAALLAFVSGASGAVGWRFYKTCFDPCFKRSLLRAKSALASGFVSLGNRLLCRKGEATPSAAAMELETP